MFAARLIFPAVWVLAWKMVYVFRTDTFSCHLCEVEEHPEPKQRRVRLQIAGVQL